MRVLSALLLAATAAPALTAADTAPIPVHGYAALALSPKGDRIATVEMVSKEHGAIRIRSAADGHVLTTIDPCATCSYAGLGFARDGALAFITRDRTKGTSTLRWSADGKVHTVATVAGLASTPRFSPDGARIALLVTIGATKETGANQAGAREIGEIGDKSDEQRLAIFDRNATLVGDGVKPLSPPTATSTNMTGRPTGTALSSPARWAMATTTGGWPRWMRWMPRPVRSAPSRSPPPRSTCPASRPMAKASPSSAAS
jgi:hypothetical protein